MNYNRLEHRFVENIPDSLEPSVLYLSMPYATAAHLCCCGCGEEVITPFSPTDWKMIFNGEAITIHPSIGNWSFSCRSHYFIRDGRVVEAPPWSEEQVMAGRLHDKRAKDAFFEKSKARETIDRSTDSSPRDRGIWSRIRSLFTGEKS
ncbi:MAG: DUF6527 family protein [Verrucomicrobiota bacterium]